MTHRLIYRRIVLFFAALTVLTILTLNHPNSGTLFAATLDIPDRLQAGQATLLTVRNFPEDATLSGTIDGEPFPITPEGEALIALDMEEKSGEKQLKVSILNRTSDREVIDTTITVLQRDYPVERIDGIPSGKVSLTADDLTRAKKESRAIRSTYRKRGGITGYTWGFRMPVKGRISGVFGSRRILNGEPRSPHNGVDIAAPSGTPVMTTAPGRVLLVGEDFFFTGNTIVIDHGDGVISLYAHLKNVQVKQGAWLAPETIIGAVGMSGRATGPHLHWGVLVRGMRVDPLLLPGILETE